MTGTTPAPPAGRTAPAPKGPNWWLIGGGILLVVIAIAVAIALWSKAPAAPSRQAGSRTVAETTATPWKGDGLPPGVEVRDGAFAAANGGNATTVTFGSTVPLNGGGGALTATIDKKSGTFTITVVSSDDQPLGVKVVAGSINGTFPSQLFGVSEYDAKSYKLVLTGKLGDFRKGVGAVSVYYAKR